MPTRSVAPRRGSHSRARCTVGVTAFQVARNRPRARLAASASTCSPTLAQQLRIVDQQLIEALDARQSTGPSRQPMPRGRTNSSEYGNFGLGPAPSAQQQADEARWRRPGELVDVIRLAQVAGFLGQSLAVPTRQPA
jgi:hypothetical protein